MMRVAITDANIFIDLHFLGILDFLFVLNFEIHTTQEVMDELDEEQVKYLQEREQAGDIRIYSMSSEEIAKLSELELPPGLSSTDKSVIYCASILESLILTGDAKLRRTLEQNGKEVHGIVWIFDQWVANDVMPKVNAASLLLRLLEYNSWLPMEECVSRIEQWQKA